MGESAREPATEPIGFALAAATRKLAKFYTAALGDSPVTSSQLFFLRQLWREDELALTVLRERAQLDATSTTWLADQLEKAGLIERRRDNPDRRVVERESSLAQTLEQHRSPAEVATFKAVLWTLIDTLPDGNDLWSDVSERWGRTLESLRAHLEADER